MFIIYVEIRLDKAGLILICISVRSLIGPWFLWFLNSLFTSIITFSDLWPEKWHLLAAAPPAGTYITSRVIEQKNSVHTLAADQKVFRSHSSQPRTTVTSDLRHFLFYLGDNKLFFTKPNRSLWAEFLLVKLWPTVNIYSFININVFM